MNKSSLSESDIKAKYITPAIQNSGWNEHSQIAREVYFTDGRIIVRGKMTTRGKRKFADYILYHQPNVPLAIVEAKDNNHTIGSGMQQALNYADILDIPFVFSSNGDGFLFHDKTQTGSQLEQELLMSEFPSPQELWNRYKTWKGIDKKEEDLITEEYYSDSSGMSPRYYQRIAINRTIEAIAEKQNRILLVMATGTGKTYTAFHIIYRFWKNNPGKRILFLADRTSLIDQTVRGDFKHFGEAMTIIRNKQVDKAYNIYLALYQGLMNYNNDQTDAYKEFSPDFFDMVVVDECHRGSAKEDSRWREILEYFDNAVHIGLTATPKETNEVSSSDYFGDPIYTYSLKQGIEDGFLAPYKVVKVTLDIDAEGWRPPKGYLDKDGNQVEDRIYNTKEFDKSLVVQERRALVAKKITDFLKGFDRFAKTIVFCTDIEHAESMRSLLANENADLYSKNNRYIMRITGDSKEGKDAIDSFISPSETYPVIATTSKLLTTGVNARTCQLIVLDSNINSKSEFKQIIGRGTRIVEEYGKTYFTILDFRNVTNHFADPNFDGYPVKVIDVREEEDLEEVIEDEKKDIKEEYPDGVIEDNFEPDVSEPFGREEKKGKVYVHGVEVKILNERVQYLDGDGKIITESIKDYSKRNIVNQYASIDHFLNAWNNAEKKKAIIEELEQQGLLYNALKETVDGDYDPFDLIAHVAYDAKPLTRKERAENVKKRDYFTKYGDQAKAVINALLDKYADDGLFTIESTAVLRLDPFNKMGTPMEIIKQFGSRNDYLAAIKELEQELYKTGA